MSKPVYLYVTPFYPSENDWRGGYCHDAVKALARTGRYDVYVLRPGSNDYEYEGVKVYGFARKNLPCGFAPFLTHEYNIRSFFAKLRAMGINPKRVHVCHCHVLENALYAVALGRENPDAITLLHHHSISMVNLKSGRLGVVPVHATLLYFYYRRLCESVTAHVFVSERSRDSYAKIFRCEPEDELIDVKLQLLFGRFFRSFAAPRSIVFYNGVDTAALTAKVLRKKSDVFTIGCVGNFQPLKDQKTLLRAFKKLIDVGVFVKLKAKLIFVGTGSELARCQKFVDENDLADVVEFKTEMDHSKIWDFYRSLDLFVLPSRLEGFCCAFVEAAACGAPVIGCESISLAEVIIDKDKSKWLVPPMDVNALADRIREYYINRYSFKFSRDLDINKLWVEFLNTIEAL